MSTAPYEDQPVERKSRTSGCLIGCLITVVVLFVLAIAAYYWVSKNWRKMAGGFAATVIEQQIDASDLPAQEKTEVKEQVRRVTDAFQSGELTNDQVSRILKQFTESPLMASLVVQAVDAKYFASSGLSDEEKAEGRITLRRVVQGAVDESISQEQIDTLMAHVADREGEGQWRLRENVSDEELRELLTEAKQMADEAEVAPDPPEIDPSDELKRIIDESIAQP